MRIAIFTNTAPTGEKRLPWFPHYAADYLLDPAINSMSPAQRGMFWHMLSNAWQTGGGCLPNEPENFWKWAGAKSLADFEKNKDKVLAQFAVDTQRNLIVNRPLETLWKESQEKSKRFQESGKRGANKR